MPSNSTAIIVDVLLTHPSHTIARRATVPVNAQARAHILQDVSGVFHPAVLAFLDVFASRFKGVGFIFHHHLIF